MTEPLLFLCTNGGRDRCCALFGRGLFDELADPRVWECSHLSGHRFAPTAVRLPDLTVFGRLDPATAREALDGGPAAACLRGPAGCCQTWGDLTTVWATDPTYGPKVMLLYKQLPLACRT